MKKKQIVQKKGRINNIKEEKQTVIIKAIIEANSDY